MVKSATKLVRFDARKLRCHRRDQPVRGSIAVERGDGTVDELLAARDRIAWANFGRMHGEPNSEIDPTFKRVRREGEKLLGVGVAQREPGRPC